LASFDTFVGFTFAAPEVGTVSFDFGFRGERFLVSGTALFGTMKA
jgi:hypothetical protein